MASAAEGFVSLAGPHALPEAERCTMARALSGTRSHHCAWRFPYRDGSARARFAAFRRELERCVGPFAEAGENTRVNHPDSHDQLEHRAGPVRITLSVKDKAALSQSYVFIGVEGAPGP